MQTLHTGVDVISSAPPLFKPVLSTGNAEENATWPKLLRCVMHGKVMVLLLQERSVMKG